MTILCGTDFSPSSVAACEVAALIAASHQEALVLVHAVAPASNDRAASAEKELRDLASRLEAGGVRVSSLVKAGAADAVLLEAAAKSDARLIVLGSVGQQGLKRLLLGSTSDSIASRSLIPLLVIRGDFPARAWLQGEKTLRVGLAADLGPSTDTTVRWTSQLADRSQCEFVVIHLSSPPGDDARLAIDAPMHLDHTHPLVEQVIQRELSGITARLEGSGDTRVVVDTNTGKTGAAIAQVAAREGADLLVVGRGREEGRQWWEQSVSRAVISQAPMSVVCVPAPAQETVEPAPSIRKVLCATDFSPLGNSAIGHAKSLLGDDGAMMIVHVLDEHAPEDDAAGARQRLESLLKGLKGSNVTAEVLRGYDIAGLISAAAGRFEADLICVGSRGHAPLTKAMLGSVAQGLLLLATRPVLIVPAPL